VEDARRQRLLQLAAGGVFLAIIVVVVVIVVVSSSGGDDAGTPEPAVEGEISKLLDGIPQEEMLLGDANAPVKIYEFGDLQCPFCKANAEEVTPEVIETAVRKGEANITFRQYIIIGPESIPAGEAALASGAQGRGWNFVELFYRNQGEENSGYVTEAFIESIGKSAGIPDLKHSKPRPKKPKNSASAARRHSRSKARAPTASKSSAPRKPPASSKQRSKRSSKGPPFQPRFT
jgi:hypothetical protein